MKKYIVKIGNPNNIGFLGYGEKPFELKIFNEDEFGQGLYKIINNGSYNKDFTISVELVEKLTLEKLKDLTKYTNLWIYKLPEEQNDIDRISSIETFFGITYK